MKPGRKPGSSILTFQPAGIPFFRFITTVIVLVLLCAGAVLAVDATLPSVPSPDIEPDIIASPSSSQQVKPASQIPQPQTQIPSPVSPSEPAGPVTPVQPAVVELPPDFINVTAESMHTALDENEKPLLTTAKGNVTVRFRSVIATAASGRVDYQTNMAVLEGNVVFRIDSEEVRGERAEINIRTLEWRFDHSSTTITPEIAKGNLNAPVFANADSAHGVRDQKLEVYNADATTCNLPREHYDIRARSISVYPNDKIVFRKSSFYLRDRRLFTIPRFVVPLQNVTQNPNVLPRVGQTADEGYYLKYAYPYMGNSAQAGYLLIDLMSKKGIGQGIQQYYKTNGGNGQVYFYRLYDQTLGKTTLNGRFKHNQRIGTVLLNASSDFRSNSYLYAPQSQSLTNQFSLTNNGNHSITSLVANQTVNDVYTRTSTLTGNLHHKQTLTSSDYIDSSFNYTAYSSSGSTRAQLVSDLLYSKKQDKYDWSISAQKLTDLSDESFAGTNQFSGVERLPELSIASDSTRLGKVLPFGIPTKLNLSYGKYTETSSSTDTDRLYFDIMTPSQRRNISRTWTTLIGSEFKQFVYGDDTAQYSISADAKLSKQLGPTSTFDLTYRYQMPRGYTPFRFDYVGKYNIINASLNMKDSDRFKVSLLGGYNFRSTTAPWQDSTIRVSYKITDNVLFYTATGYNFNKGQWRTVINQVRVRTAGDFKLDLGTRYDPTGGQLATVRTVLDTPLGSKYRLQGLAGYNGVTHEFEYSSVMLTRDLHCWEASLSYVDQDGFWENRGLYFNLRLKAFPIYQSYGVGPYGQALDTSVGQVY